ncbi:YjgB family protein [Paenibacillus hunanensis]|uniref:YjgB family protein n=1 Tax=Paenibacillus hunanensis TaxID=539262 RepID=UPI002A6A6423|nr:YjgB family protein [Paenibacillus hunanensis]WPP40961.1 YjgB family protein [Paenibacillus hunanensis]
MKFTSMMYKTGIALALTGVATVGSFAASTSLTSPSAYAASTSSTASQQMTGAALLNTFYKPALKGMLPSANGNPVDKFVVGKTTRGTVVATYGKPTTSRTTASGYDIYHAEMGTPGYAMSYNSANVLKEIRYLGTQVERKQTIGSITMSVLKKTWYAPSSTSTMTTGGQKQTKLTYNRGDYKLEFIYNSPTDLDHINLLKK